MSPWQGPFRCRRLGQLRPPQTPTPYTARGSPHLGHRRRCLSAELFRPSGSFLADTAALRRRSDLEPKHKPNPKPPTETAKPPPRLPFLPPPKGDVWQAKPLAPQPRRVGWDPEEELIYTAEQIKTLLRSEQG